MKKIILGLIFASSLFANQGFTEKDNVEIELITASIERVMLDMEKIVNNFDRLKAEKGCGGILGESFALMMVLKGLMDQFYAFGERFGWDKKFMEQKYGRALGKKLGEERVNNIFTLEEKIDSCLKF